VIANIPATKIAAGCGVSGVMPLISSIVRAPAARRIFPALRKRAPFVKLLLQA
jgi:hypothetical protein